MSQPKSEILTLFIALGITATAFGALFWFLGRPLLARLSNPVTTPNSAVTNPSTSQNSTTSIPSDMPTGDRLSAIQNVPAGLFNYGGSTTWAPIRQTVDPQLQATFPDFRLRYTDPLSDTPGSGQGIKMVLEDQLAFAQSSRPLKDEEYQRAQQRGFTLEAIPVAIDGIAIAVNPSLPVTGLTIAQLKDIYAGKITNWQQVGGPNLSITPYSRSLADGGTVEFFRSNVMAEADFGPNVQYIFNTTLALRAIATTPGGIYYASAPEVVPQCTTKTLSIGQTSDQLVPPYETPPVPPEQCPNQRNRLAQETFKSGEYPITRRLFVIIKKDGQTDQQAGEAYANLVLTQEGQTLIEQAGFVSIR